MVFTKYRLNEDLQFRKREQKKLNDKSKVFIRQNIQQFFDEEKAHFHRLDGNAPIQGIREIYEAMICATSTSAITMTYKSFIQDRYDEVSLRKYMITTLETICFNENIPLRICLIPDMDEAGNFHYHGIFQLPLKYRSRFKKLCQEYIGFIKMKYIDDNIKWLEYCYKIGKNSKGIERERVYSLEDIERLGIYYFLNIN